MRFLLFPFALLYGLGVYLRNLAYTMGAFRSHAFDFPVIAVGNLRVGGTGKTPMVEYLARLLSADYNMAVVSRGYGRKTSGYILSDLDSSAKSIGDEPRQIKQKFQDVAVAVDRNRVAGIKKLKESLPALKLVVLDDAFQHRKVKAGLTIMLTAYNRFYKDDFLLPVGRLREPYGASKRADIIVVTKCPPVMSAVEQRAFIDRIRPEAYQKVCFAYEDYDKLTAMFGPERFDSKVLKNKHIILITGIANADRLKEHLERYNEVVYHMEQSDHHWYDHKDIQKVVEIHEKHRSSDTIIITTEKDAQRLIAFRKNESFADLPIFYLPIRIQFHKESIDDFNEAIQEYVRSYQSNQAST